MLLYIGLSTWRVQNYYLWAVALLLCSSPLEWGGWFFILSTCTSVCFCSLFMGRFRLFFY